MIVAHHKALKITANVYPFWKSNIKSLSVSPGSHTFVTENIFHGQVPCNIIIGMVDNEAYSGCFLKNPFNYQNMFTI